MVSLHRTLISRMTSGRSIWEMKRGLLDEAERWMDGVSEVDKSLERTPLK